MAGIYKDYPIGMSDKEKEIMTGYLEGNQGENSVALYDSLEIAVYENTTAQKFLEDLKPDVEAFVEKHAKRKFGVSPHDVSCDNIVAALAELDTFVIMVKDANGKVLQDYFLLEDYGASDVKALFSSLKFENIPSEVITKCVDSHEPVTFVVKGKEYTFCESYRNIGMELINGERNRIINWMTGETIENEDPAPVSPK